MPSVQGSLVTILATVQIRKPKSRVGFLLQEPWCPHFPASTVSERALRILLTRSGLTGSPGGQVAEEF